MRAVDASRFWSYIDVLDGEVTEETALGLEAALVGLGAAELEDFAATLLTVLRSIDLSAFAGLPVRDVTDPPGGVPLPLSGTALEYFTGALVAAGESVYRAALAEPTSVLSRIWRTEDTPLLLEAVAVALEQRTGNSWEAGEDYTTALTSDDQDEDTRDRWMRIGNYLDMGQVLPPDYDNAQTALSDAINISPVWRDWWSAAGRDELSVGIDFIVEGDSRLYRQGRTRISVAHRPDYNRFVGEDSAALQRYAAEDLSAALSNAEGKAGLGKLPPLPAVPELPDQGGWEAAVRNARPDPVALARETLRSQAADGDKYAASVLAVLEASDREAAEEEAAEQQDT